MVSGRLIAGALIGLAVLLGPASRPALAHQPLLVDGASLNRGGATAIPDADIAWAAFGVLPPNATQYLVFSRPASGQFRARVLVGTRQANTALNPWLALVGPGLPRPDGLGDLLGEGEGAVLVAPAAERTVEPFQATPFPVLVGASMALTLPGDGPYFLLVFDPSGGAGPYVIDTGYLQD